MMKRLVEYQPWKGFGLWIGLSIVDFAWNRSGMLSMAGFVLALLWAIYVPKEG